MKNLDEFAQFVSLVLICLVGIFLLIQPLIPRSLIDQQLFSSEILYFGQVLKQELGALLLMKPVPSGKLSVF